MYIVKIQQGKRDLFLNNDNSFSEGKESAALFKDYYEAAHQLAGALYPGNNGLPGSGNLKEPLVAIICVAELPWAEETFCPGG